MIGILGGMGTQAGLDFCNKLAILYRGKIDQEYPLFMLYNKSNIPGRPESIGTQTKNLSNRFVNKKSKKKYFLVLKSLLKGCRLLEKSKCKYIEKIYLTKVDNKYCNIRMLPENINCLDLVNIRSDIKHINFLKK